METTVSARHYTDIERLELIEQWKQSGKNKAVFCKERSIPYYSFNDWIKQKKKKSGPPKSSFVPMKIKNQDALIFTQLILKNGATVNIYRHVEANYLATLLKA